MDFKTLAKKLAEITLGTARMTDIKDGVYHIAFGENDSVILVSDKAHKVPVSNMATLASLRICESPEVAKKAVNTRDARTTEGYSNLQSGLKSEAIALDDKTTFKVIHRLQIQDIANEAPIYQNPCYKGYPEYVKASRKAANLPNATEEQTKIRNAAFTDASEELRKSGVKAGTTATAENLLLMPVFQVVVEK